MAVTAEPRRLSEVFLLFTSEGRFPDDIASLPPVSQTDLDPSIRALDKLRIELQAQVHNINEETKEDVRSWVKNAKILQEDIIRSKAIANDIVRQSEAPDISGEAIQDAEEKAGFLNREVQYSRQIYDALRSIQHIDQLLGEVEQARNEHRVLDSLRLLEKSWAELDQVGVSRSCRVMKLLDLRTFELKSAVHDVFDHVWKALLYVDIDARRIVICDSSPNQKMNLSDAVIGLRAYKEVDERMEQLWRHLDSAIVSPRMATNLPISGVTSNGNVLQLQGTSEPSVDALLSDLETVMKFLSLKIPSELIQSLCPFMMTDLIPKLIQQWLDPAVPSSLTNMANFQQAIRKTERFCSSLQESGFSGIQGLCDWVNKAPMIWLGKCRESALDTVRQSLTKGIGGSKSVEKVEKQMVSISEGKELAAKGAGAAAEANDCADDWGAAWDDENDLPSEERRASADGGECVDTDGHDDGTGAWGWDEDETADAPADEARKGTGIDDEDEGADAWGWGDDEDTSPRAKEKKAQESRQKVAARRRPSRETAEQMRELVLRETYHISSMPEPVLDLISSILEDGATLTQPGDEYACVASMAPGLFSLPTFVLALFRAVSPYYYSLGAGGSMFLYNDAMFLAQKLSDFASWWKERQDLTPRARGMLRLENDIKSLQRFANRSYASEMNIQRTVLRDLLGGAQSIIQQDQMGSAVEAGVGRIRSMAATWEGILARSVWSQAIGSLADALAVKLITDVLEMASIGQDEAYGIAKLIALATELDDLFLPSKLCGAAAPEDDEVPATAQYAPSWLRLKYLSEVLQSNLNEVRYLWMESELSLYFSAEEVVDLIRASFEDNARTRAAIREVQAKPGPLGGTGAPGGSSA